ncbi:T9SS type A sorting domain-containing protein [Flavobacteriaceae sp. LMIT009]
MKNDFFGKLVLVLILFILSNISYSQTPSFPDANGFGKFATGGRGGAVIKVTNLNDSGPGSFRAACNANGPRTIIFEVSGIIELSSSIEVRNGNLTIAGQTAPGDGICIKGAGFIVSANDVIVRYLRFRLGDNGYKDANNNVVGSNSSDYDTVGVYGNGGRVENVIFDHCSMSWSIDEIIGMYGSTNSNYGVNNVTFQNCIFSEALRSSHHSEGSHSMAFLMNQNVNNVSIYKNYFAHSDERHVRAGGGCSFEFINNLVFDYGYSCIVSAETEFAMIGNHYKAGNENVKSSHLAEYVDQTGFDPLKTRAFVGGNTSTLNISEIDDKLMPYLQPSPPLSSGIVAEDSQGMIQEILANVGASYPSRDNVDERVINDYFNNSGNWINTQAQVGGYPVYNSDPAPQDTDNDGMPDSWEDANGLNKNDPSDRNHYNPDGYTNLEYYLNNMVLSTDVNAGEDQSICEGDSATLTASGSQSYVWSTGETSRSITVTPNTTTTYSVTGTDSEGNTTTDSVIVTVNEVPIANAGEDAEVCEGNEIILTASGGTTYLWSNGETSQTITVSPTTTTNYSVIATTNGCSSTDEVTVTVLPRQTINAGSDVDINYGESTTLTVTGGVGDILWSTGETTESITVSPTNNTTYTVQVTGANGCIATDEINVTVIGSVNASAGNDVNICEGESTVLTASGGDDYLWSTGETTPSITVYPDTTTTYTVVVSNSVTSDSDEVTVFVTEIPDVEAGDDEQINLGEYVTLSATGADTYLWSNGATQPNIAVSPQETTTYYVTGFTNNCSSVDNVTVNVANTINAYAGKDQVICSGESITLTATGGANYEWSTGEITQSIEVAPEETTTYSVNVSNDYGSATDDVIVTIVSCGEEEEELDSNFRYDVYPNPVLDGKLNISLGGLQTESSIYIHDGIGRLVYFEEVDANNGYAFQKEINTSGFNSGMYFVTLEEQERTITKKIIFR